MEMEISSMTEAMQLHAQVIKQGEGGIGNKNNALALSKVFTFSALSVSGSITYARSIFNSLQCQCRCRPNSSYFSNTMLRAYAATPDPNQALLFFLQLRLQPQHHHKPDRFTFPFLLQSCSRLRAAPEGKQLHACIYKARLSGDLFVLNSLIHFYSSACGDLNSALLVFDKMSDRDVVSWTSIIDACVDCRNPAEALKLFDRMQNAASVALNDATAVSVLRACADAGALSVGKKVHQMVTQGKLDSKANVVTALIDMYSKCGCIDSAQRLFDNIAEAERDVFAWTAMISGLASHGHSKNAIDLFHQMQKQKQKLNINLRPDDRTMTAVLSACRNAGWVSEGCSLFENMKNKYKIQPKIQHYGCMVDLFARAGHLNEAEELIKMMPIEPDAIIWRTLIWACKIYGDVDRGERLILKMMDSNSSMDSGSYVLLGNMYASAGKWNEKARVRGLMTHRRIEKSPGCSKIEVNGTIHEFVAGDSGHPEAEKIYEKWVEIAEKLRLQGYRPKLSEVLLDIEDGDKASQLQHHSEKLAVAFGLISTHPESKILVVKNLRSCEDCHSAMKFVSKIYQREIIVRDRIRFHHFKNGVCSCGDYW